MRENSSRLTIILPPWNKIFCFKKGSKKKRSSRAELFPAIVSRDCYLFKSFITSFLYHFVLFHLEEGLTEVSFDEIILEK